MCREQQNSTERVRILALDNVGAGVTGATVVLSIRRDADGHYWTGAAFGAAFNTVAMTETDATNRAGEYHYDFNTTGLADAVYSLRSTTATATVVNDPFEGEIKIGGFVDNIDVEVSSRLATSGYTVPPTVGAIADQIWDEATVGHTTSGTFGEQAKTDIDAILADTDSLDTTKITTARAGKLDNLDVVVSTRSSHSAADVWAAGTRTLTSSLDPTAATIADAICDEIISGHLTTGSLGDYLNRIKKVVFNRLVVAAGAYTVYADNGTDTFSTGTTSSDDGNRTPV